FFTRRVKQFRTGWRDLGSTLGGGRGGPQSTAARLDDRYAARGTLALVRDVPQLGAAIITILLIVAAITVASRTGSDGSAGEALDLPAVSGPGAQANGPLKGDTIADYIAGARADLTALVQQSPKEQTYAIA